MHLEFFFFLPKPAKKMATGAKSASLNGGNSTWPSSSSSMTNDPADPILFSVVSRNLSVVSLLNENNVADIEFRKATEGKNFKFSFHFDN